MSARYTDNYAQSICAALLASCVAGRLSVTTWLAEQFDEENWVRLSTYKHRALQSACANGHATVAQWLLGRFPDMIHKIVGVGEKLLSQACERGHLNIAKWLTYINDYTKDGNFEIDSCMLLTDACENGHIHVAQWIVSKFRITRIAPPLHQYEGVTVIDNKSFGFLLFTVGKSGHLVSVQWLLNQFNLITDANESYVGYDEFDRTLHGACSGGHVHIAEWLIAHFSDKLTNMRLRLTEQRGVARDDENDHIAEWLTSRFELDPEKQR
jgi:hypothetical protein